MTSSSTSSKKSKKLPAHLEEQRTRVFIENDAPTHTVAIDSADAYEAYGLDQSFNMDDFKRDFQIRVIEKNEEKIVFDMIGITAPLANALRRIMLSEIPTMAIEKVFLYQNTSIIQDEVLSHRLGLIPIRADPRMFQYLSEQDNHQPNELNTLVFTLDVKCTRNPNASATAPDHEKYINSTVLSRDLIWIPQGRQATVFADRPIAPMYDDIVIAKLRPGQHIEAELHVEKGIGQTHAKWSPVATASYRLLPEIILNTEISGSDAQTLINKCPMNVFDIEDIGGTKHATVARPRNCSMCRECIREPSWNSRISLRRVRDHFIFSVETVGAYTPQQIVREAFNVLKTKARVIKQELKNTMPASI